MRYGLIDVELALAEDASTELVLLDSELDVVEEHLVDHLEHVVAHVLLVHLQKVQLLCQLSELAVRVVQQLLRTLVFGVVPRQVFEAGQLDQLKVVLQRLEDLFEIVRALPEVASPQVPSPLLPDFPVDLGALRRVVDVVFQLPQHLLHIVLLVFLLNQLLVELSLASVESFLYVLRFLCLLFTEILELSL